MKILVTGANGYIGARLCEFLSMQGFDIIAVCSSSIPEKKEWVEKIDRFIIGDIRNEWTIKEIVAAKADVILHLISLDHHDSELNPNLVSQVNVQPTWNILDKLSSGNTLKKFIYFSTIHVYGKNQNQLVDESQIVTPFNAYGLTHALSEEIVNYYHRKTEIDCINIRLSNSYGEPIFHDAKCWSLIVNDLSKSAYVNKKIVLRSDGSAMRDFVHFSDICKGIRSLITDHKRLENTMHFCSSNTISMLEVALNVKEVYKSRYGDDIPIYINSDILFNEEEFKKDNRLIKVSNDRAKNRSLSFKKELKEGINDLFIYLEDYA